MHNDTYSQPIKVSVNRANKYEAYNQVYSEALKLHQEKPKIISMMELFQEYGNNIPLFEEKETQ